MGGLNARITGLGLAACLVHASLCLGVEYADVVIKGVPHVKQKPDFCGEACVEMWLRKLGKDVDQDHVFDQGGVDPLKGRGCHTPELNAALKKMGFRTGRVWRGVKVAQAGVQLEALWKEVHADLMRGVPSVVCMRYEDKGPEHFRLVLGYDRNKDSVIYHEPAEAGGAYRTMSRAKFLKLWPLKYRQDQWTVIRFPLKAPAKIEGKTSTVFTNADYTQHIRRLKKKLPKGFTMVLQPPFVVAGDETARTVKRRSARTVKWAADKLMKAYFKRHPRDIITVWLFKDRASYLKHNLRLFNTRPTTPFGYYSSTHKALVMNIATGGGTLVHEIVHPFMAANFPDCPDWFNEGLASLYEQSGERQGRIVGFTNWRLPGLQKAIREKRVPSFRKLTATTTHQFYEMDRGTNYSQARYLCYYLQQKGLLRKYYHAFDANRRKDPAGYDTLKKVLGEKDMAAFKKRWETWVLGLRYR